MHRKDYKEIAKEIKSCRFLAVVHTLDALHRERKDGLQMPICESDVISKRLADYFEREDSQISGTVEEMKKYRVFNKKQFLADCGVD